MLNGEKHYFSEVYNQDGIALYIMKKQKGNPWDYLYLFYEGWMLDVGNLIQMISASRNSKRQCPTSGKL
jgi:hypothetical protein